MSERVVVPAVESGWKYANVTAAGLVKTGLGTLHSLVINKPVNADTITIYDNTAASGTKIGTITISGAVPVTLIYDVQFLTGLYVSPSSSNDDITVSYA